MTDAEEWAALGLDPNTDYDAIPVADFTGEKGIGTELFARSVVEELPDGAIVRGDTLIGAEADAEDNSVPE